MDLFPPKLRDLELWPLKDSEIKIMPNTVWQIDAPVSNSFLWSFTLSYLTSSLESGVLRKSLRKLHEDNGIHVDDQVKQAIQKIEKVTSKFNPFKNYHSIYWDRTMNLFLSHFESNVNFAAKRISTFPENFCENCTFLTKAANVLKCVIHVYNTSAYGNDHLYSFFPDGDILEQNFVRLILFQHMIREENGSTILSKYNEKFGFAISLNYAHYLRKSALFHVLKRANLSENEIEETIETVEKTKSFLPGLLQNSKDKIISKLYKSPYIIKKLTDAGFDADPTSVDENGLSSFYYCMGLKDADMLRLLYHFSTKNVLIIDNTIVDPDEIQTALDKTAAAIKNDCEISSGFFALHEKKKFAFKRCIGILRLNDFQYKAVNAIFRMKQNNTSGVQQQRIMISILELYREYHYFLYSPRIPDSPGLFQDFLKYSQYYEDLDNFICLLFFHNFSSLIPLINEDNRNVFSNTVSSLFLNILSHKFFPKCGGNLPADCCSCKFGDEVCEQNHNFQRYIVYHHRRRFSESAEALVNELKVSTNTSEPSGEPLLEEINRGLISLPEIEDDFLIVRLKRHLDTVIELIPKSRSTKGMFTIERAIQVVGETLQNQTISDTFVKFFLHVLLPPEIEYQFFRIRDHSLGHYRRSSVQGRLEIENQGKFFFEDIQEELKNIGILFLPIYVSQFLRVEEFMIKIAEQEAEKHYKEVNLKVNLQLREITNKRKQLFLEQTDSLVYLLTKTFLYFENKLKNEGSKFSEEFKCELQAFEFLVSLITKHCIDCYPDELVNLSAELNNFILNFCDFKTPEEKKNNLKVILSKYLHNLRNIFDSVNEQDFKFPHLSSMFEKMKYSRVFTLIEKEEINAKVLEYFDKSKALLQWIKEKLKEIIKIKRELESSGLMPKDSNAWIGLMTKDMRKKLDIIIMPEKKRNCINECIPANMEKALELLRSVKESDVKSLLDIPESNMFAGMLTKKEQISALLKIKFRPRLKNKLIQVINQKLWFLIDRISRLKKILIFEDEDICFLWKSGRWERNPEMEKRIKYLMIQRYLNEKDLRSTIEMLLFDCMNILEKPELITLWKKANYMFIGANMVHFLAHGNPIVESITALLFPEDLPSEIINEIFELLKDEISMRALSELWEKAKVGGITAFENIVEEPKKDKWSGLRSCIKRSPRWKLYMSMLPLRK